MNKIVLGTRGSELALRQARHVGAELIEAVPDLMVEIKKITTTGDKLMAAKSTDPLPRGLFTREIETALMDGGIDTAVHSLKDLPTDLPDGLTLTAVPVREDISEALVSRDGLDLDGLPPGSTVGSGSFRRRAFLLALRPDLRVEPIQGNVPTRIRKLDGEYDAVILARAGLIRLGLEERITQVLSPEIFTPAPGQGALGLEVREDDRETIDLLATINDGDSFAAITAERSFLEGLGGGCRLPIGAWGRVESGRLLLDGAVADPDGKTVLRDKVDGDPDDAERLGRVLAEALLSRGADKLLEQVDQMRED